MWYNLIFKNSNGETINFTDWEKKTVDFLDEHKNIKKVWLVNKQRKTGSTYFAKLLMFFRPPCTNTFVISNNLDWSKIINRSYPISFKTKDCDYILSKDCEYCNASNFLTPVTLFGLEKEVEKNKKNYEMWEDIAECFSGSTPSYECLYDRDFNLIKYKTLCSYNFDFFIVNVSPKDLEIARPFIEADKDKEDVLIVNIENTLFPEIYEELIKK